MIFPVLILGAFCYLVIKHHGKLYAPKDYKKDESFLQTLNDFDSFVRLSTETFGQQEVPPTALEEANNDNESRGEEIFESRQDSTVEGQPTAKTAEHEEASAAAARPATDTSVGKLSEDPPPTAISMLSVDNDLDIIEHAKRSKQIAKMKELLELTKHFIEVDSRFVGVDVRTNVKMGSTGIVYDAAAYTDNGLQCLEVKYLTSASYAKNLLLRYINQARVVKSAVSPVEFHLKLVLVYDSKLNVEGQLRAVVASARQEFQDFISVELVPRPSVRA